MLAAKPGPRASGDDERQDTVDKLLEATLHGRVATMRYHSVSSGRSKDYTVHPYRLAFAQGDRGTITGTVADPAGGPGAVVSVGLLVCETIHELVPLLAVGGVDALAEEYDCQCHRK